VHRTKQDALEKEPTNPWRGQGATGPSATGRLLQPGTKAPAFTLNSAYRTIALADYRGRAVILAFYPADWSPVCGDQMALYNEILPDFRDMGAELLGISVDSTWCHAAFARERHLHFPLLSDFHPKGEVARQYGAYCDSDGTCERALFVIDRDGVIHWSYLSPIDINPGADGIVEALSTLPARADGTTRFVRPTMDAEARP
jgi:peroxiredoxin